MDNNENKNQETELEEVKTEEAVDNADDVEEAQIEKGPVLSFEYDVKTRKRKELFSLSEEIRLCA